jgi:hypothetical protein
MTGNMLPQAYLWTHEDDVWDISPGNDAKNPWKVTITHSVGPVVTVTASGGVLRITTSSGAFDADAKYEHHERLIHPPADATKDVSYVVTSIAVTGASSTADPPLPGSKWDTTTSPYHPHYTLGFCYH